MTASSARLAVSLALAASSAALCAQTAAKPPVRHTTTAAHRAATPATAAKGSGCSVDIPTLSPKIPALAATSPCPKPLYTLSYIDTEIGTGAPAVPRKWYTVHYTGYLLDGTKFDSSHDHPGGEPITFPYGARQVIPGWDTGFEGMHVGGKRRLFIPYQLAYGESGRPPVIPAKSELIFDVELVGISDNPPQPKTPPAAPAQPATSKPGDTQSTSGAGSSTAPAAGAAKPATSKPADTANPATPPPTQNTTPDAAAKPKS